MNTLAPISRRVYNPNFFIMVFIILAVFMNSYGQLQKGISHLFPTINQQSNSTYSFNRKTKMEALMDSIKEVRKIRSMNQKSMSTSAFITQKWQNNQWINDIREISTYDDRKYSSHTIQQWKNENWSPYQRYRTRFDERGNDIEYLSEYWTSNGWAVNFISNSVYNTNNQAITFISKNYNETGSELISNFIGHMSYNSQGLLSSRIDSTWYNTSQNWYVTRTVNQYDSLGNLIEDVYEVLIDAHGNRWNPFTKTIYVYDDQNKQIQYTNYYWNSDSEIWLLTGRHTSFHDEQNHIDSNLYEDWINMTWVTEYYSIYQYTEDLDNHTSFNIHESYEYGILKSKTRESSFYIQDTTYCSQPAIAYGNTVENWLNGQWVYEKQYISWNGLQHGTIANTVQTWKDGDWQYESRSFPEENPMVDSELFPETFSLTNYPNPFNSSTTILFRVPKTADVKLTIFDLMGRPTTELENGKFENGLYQSTWSGKDESGRSVSSGVYIIHLTIGNTRESKKIILTK